MKTYSIATYNETGERIINIEAKNEEDLQDKLELTGCYYYKILQEELCKMEN